MASDVERRWKRIADDLRTTTGHVLVLNPHPKPDDWWDFDVSLDQTRKGSFGRVFSADEEEFVVQLADYLCDSFLHEEIWGGWPICPDHGTHPLEPSLDEAAVAVWRCPIGRVIARVGFLHP